MVSTRSATGATPRKAPASPSTPRRQQQRLGGNSSRQQQPSSSKWLADNPSKRWTELFFLAYSPFWIAWALCVLVPFKLYDRLDEWGYLAVGLAAALPCFLLPLLVLKPCAADVGVPLSQRHWVKANVWIAVFSHIGNYFWTHYFFNLLGASYTFPAHLLNGVPVALYLMTHAYFCFYHALANVALRRVDRALSDRGASARARAVGRALAVFSLAYATAYGETITIAHFPHYAFLDRAKMYSVGSLFYAIYFWVSFPLFARIEEDEWGTPASGRRWSLSNVALDALAAGMLVTVLLDAWRLAVGGIVVAAAPDGGGAGSGGGMEQAAAMLAAQGRGLQWAADGQGAAVVVGLPGDE